MTTEKITKQAMFEAIKATFETGECKFDADTVIEFCDKEIAALKAKSAKAKERAAAKKAEADTLMAEVEAVLTTEEFLPIAEVAARVSDPDATVSKVTYRLTQLVKTGVAEKQEISIPGVDGGKARKVQGYRKLAD